MTDRTDILTPVGRLVMGDCFKGFDKDADGRPLLIKNGPNVGKPFTNYFMAIAISKTDPEYAALWTTIYNVARASFPGLYDAAGNCLNPEFAYKIIDGDSEIPNSKGKRPCDKEGFPGHWILNFSGGFAPKCYIAGGLEVITNPDAIKRGYFIRISGSVSGNESQSKPGVYLNHSMIELIGYGPEIITGPDGASVFGGHPAANIPAGMSTTPPAPSTAPAGAPPAPGAAAGAPPAPATNYLNPVPYTYMVNGTEFTREQLVASGWTDVQIAAL